MAPAAGHVHYTHSVAKVASHKTLTDCALAYLALHLPTDFDLVPRP